MNKRHLILLSALTLSAVTTAVNAQAQKTMSLSECIEMAGLNNLSLRSGRIAVERTEALQGTAFDLDKTDISLSQDPTSGGSPDNALSFSQTFEFPTIYGARRNALKAETQLERNKLEVTRNELEKNVAAGYYELLYTIERRRILIRQAELYKRFLFIANAKLNAGETGRLEQMNAQRLSKENDMALSNADKDVQTARYKLQLWLNTDDEISPVEDSLTVIDDASVTLMSFNSSATPTAQMLNQQLRVSEKNLNVARQGYLPSISVGFSTQLLIKGFNPYDIERERFEKGNFMGFDVGVSVPLFFGGQRARVKAAKHDVSLAETQMEEQLQRLDKEYKAAHNEYLKAKQSLDYYRTEGKAQANELVRISQLSYEKGDIGYVEYVQNLQTAVSILDQYAEAINNYNQAVITLKYLQGGTK